MKDEWEYPLVSAEIIMSVCVATYFARKHAKSYRITLSSVHNDAIWQSTRVSPMYLTCFRFIVLLYFIGIQLYSFYKNGTHPLLFYTTWNFILQIVYFAVVSYLSWQIQRDRQVAQSIVHAAFILFDVCFTCSFLVATVLWFILYPMYKKAGTEAQVFTFTSYTQHGINVLVLLIEFAMNQFEIQPVHAAFVVYWPTIYALFAWIVHSENSFWPYPFMEVREPYSPLWYLGLLIAHLCFFSIALLASTLKSRYITNSRKNIDRRLYDTIGVI